ncbi:flagellar basal body P-ring formation chaperone FlgA [Glycocaulis abyssi]|uniref:Flagellar basal body P-ring formation chaperone FlgA n=1 Tax=Glycocaulis abyssi TaxID=1433403 RepID=A0ABV9NB75_9PROT
MMRMLTAALILAILGTAYAAAQQNVLLRERVVVEGAVVTLGDLFEGVEGEAAQVTLARAPQPGARTFLDPAWVSRQASRNGLEWANATGIERVAVERASQSLSAGDIAELIAAHMYRETGRSHEVTLSNRMMSIHAPIDAAAAPEIVRLELDGRTGPFRAEIRSHEGGDPVTVTGRADPVLDVPVLARPLARGEVIEAGDIEWVRMRSDRIRADAITSETALVGQEARRALRAGEALRGYDLREPAAITRGETVALVFQSGPLTLTARARALENAALGQTARFVNLQSNRTVEGVVEGPGRARVTGASGHIF